MINILRLLFTAKYYTQKTYYTLLKPEVIVFKQSYHIKNLFFSFVLFIK